MLENVGLSCVATPTSRWFYEFFFIFLVFWFLRTCLEPNKEKFSGEFVANSGAIAQFGPDISLNT